jgi:DNA-binding transcriptional regulator YhcF (GntR family)
VQLTIDPTNSVPIYQQIRDGIVEAIADGRLAPGSPLRPVRKLAAEFRINPSTVVKAYDLLRHEGFIQTSRNAGTFVTSRRPPDREFMQSWARKVRTLFSEAKAKGASDEDIIDIARELLTIIGQTPAKPKE